MFDAADGALTRTTGECAVVGEGTNDLQVVGYVNCATVLMTSTVALTPVMSYLECPCTRVRIVVRGKQGDGVASGGKLFDIVPDKLKKLYIKFSAAREIDSYNVQSSIEFAVC